MHNSFQICAKRIATKRYQVMSCKAGTNNNEPHAASISGALYLHAARYYKHGCIINPAKVIKELIAASKEVTTCA